MSMLSRDFGHGGYAAGCANNPPPLHVYDTDSIAANWFPVDRPYIRPTPGMVLVEIPQPAGHELGEDPTDAGTQRVPRVVCEGMIGRPLIWEPDK